MKKYEAGKWYLFCTGTNREKKAERMLLALAPTYGAKDYIYEVYCPQEETKMPDGKIVYTKLYPGYILVRMDNYEQFKPLFRKVSTLKIYPSDEAVVQLTPEESDALYAFKYKDEAIKEEYFSVDQEVKVVKGVFDGFTGKIIEVNSTKQVVKLLVNIFGRPTSVELPFSEIEKGEK